MFTYQKIFEMNKKNQKYYLNDVEKKIDNLMYGVR